VEDWTVSEPSAEELEAAAGILTEARKAADNWWALNGIYPKRKQDTVDFFERKYIAAFAARAVANAQTEWARYDEAIRDQAVAEERERCAKIAEAWQKTNNRRYGDDIGWNIAAAIRNPT
jgi:hypothetical protein